MPVSIKSVGPTIQSDPDLAIQEIDAVFETAGLVRNLRPKAGGLTRRNLAGCGTGSALAWAE
jgi:hypothetical protein